MSCQRARGARAVWLRRTPRAPVLLPAALRPWHTQPRTRVPPRGKTPPLTMFSWSKAPPPLSLIERTVPHVLGGVHRDEHLTGRGWRPAHFVAEPSAFGERGLDRCDARRPLGISPGRLVLQASGMREIQRTSHTNGLPRQACGYQAGAALTCQRSRLLPSLDSWPRARAPRRDRPASSSFRRPALGDRAQQRAYRAASWPWFALNSMIPIERVSTSIIPRPTHGRSMSL
jgi:hypothetical protein